MDTSLTTVAAAIGTRTWIAPVRPAMPEQFPAYVPVALGFTTIDNSTGVSAVERRLR